MTASSKKRTKIEIFLVLIQFSHNSKLFTSPAILGTGCPYYILRMDSQSSGGDVVLDGFVLTLDSIFSMDLYFIFNGFEFYLGLDFVLDGFVLTCLLYTSPSPRD